MTCGKKKNLPSFFQLIFNIYLSVVHSAVFNVVSMHLGRLTGVSGNSSGRKSPAPDREDSSPSCEFKKHILVN